MLGAVLVIVVFGMVVYVFGVGGGRGYFKVATGIYGGFFWRGCGQLQCYSAANTLCIAFTVCVKGDIKQRSIMGPFDGNEIFFKEKKKLTAVFFFT